MNEKVISTGNYSGAVIETYFLNGLICNLSNYSSVENNNLFHAHINSHIGFLLQGNYIESRKNVISQRKPGELFFCNSYEAHKFQTSGGFQNLNIEIKDEFLKAYNLKENQIENSLTINNKAKSNILKILFELGQRDENLDASITLLLLEILTPENYKTTNRIPKWVHNIKDLVSDKWNENLTLEELSSTLNVHPVTISKYFSKYFNCTYGEYCRRIKINKSIELIRNTKLSMTEIAHKCGFSDQSHFTRTFKHLNGFTPKQFQKF